MSPARTVLTGIALAFVVPAPGCTDDTLEGEFRGRHEAGFERNTFYPCGSKQWWVLSGAAVWEAENAYLRSLDAGVGSGVNVDLRVRGTRIPLGENVVDHADYYQHELIVDEVVEILPAGLHPDFCDSPPE